MASDDAIEECWVTCTGAGLRLPKEWSSDDGDTAMRTWRRLLQPMTDEQLRVAVGAHLAGPRGTYMPRPAELLALVDRTRTKRVVVQECTGPWYDLHRIDPDGAIDVMDQVVAEPASGEDLEERLHRAASEVLRASDRGQPAPVGHAEARSSGATRRPGPGVARRRAPGAGPGRGGDRG